MSQPTSPPRVERPASISCELKAHAVSVSATLKLSVNGPDYAVLKDVKEASADLSLPDGGLDQGAFLEVNVGGVSLSGAIAPEDVTLHPARPLPYGNVATLQPAARLKWVNANTRGVTAEFIPATRASESRDGSGWLVKKDVGIVAVSVPPQVFACADLGLASAAVPEQPAEKQPKLKWAKLSSDNDIGVAPAPDAKPEATLRFDQIDRASGGALVRVEENLGGKTRIVFRGKDAVVVGWVASAEVTEVASAQNAAEFGMVGLSDGGQPPPSGSPPTSPTVRHCNGALRLVAERDGARKTVGELRSGTAFTPEDETRDFTRIEVVLPPGITLSPGASLSVPTAELTACSARAAVAPN